MNSRIQDLTGNRYGRLTVVSYTGRKTESGHNAIWLCRCDCGRYVERDSGQIKVYKVPSCGCYVKEHASNLNKTHGGRHDRLYLVWMDMRRRCADEKDANYQRYGGRGIKVCDEWQDYAVFRRWALENGYNQEAKKQECTIDRINANGNYEPSNCRWVDCKTQQNNRRNNTLITYLGKTQTVSEWAKELGFNREIVYKRLKAGWSFERAITEPSRYERISAAKAV